VTEHANEEQPLNQPKKINLADAIKNKLNQKKQMNQGNQKSNLKAPAGNMAMKSQNTKKMNIMRRKSGGS